MTEIAGQAPENMPRTECSCRACTVGCKSMPGGLIPGDLGRIQAYVGDTSDEFVQQHFWWSEGARVGKEIDGQRYVFNVPSIVPAQTPDGRCVFLDSEDKCRIHAVSPFGCSRMDTHMAKAEGDKRVNFMVTSQIMGHQLNDDFSRWCLRLETEGRWAPPLIDRQRAFRAALQ